MNSPAFDNFQTATAHVAPFSHAVERGGWIQLTGRMPAGRRRRHRAGPGFYPGFIERRGAVAEIGMIARRPRSLLRPLLPGALTFT